jgi:hypothetical protein
MNCYADITEFKSFFELKSGSSYEADYLRMVTEASRDVDRDTARHFYSWEGTRYFATGKNMSTLHLPIDDLQSYSAIAVDLDGSGTYVTLDLTKTPPDAMLLDDELTVNKLPYICLEANPSGSYPVWGESIRKAVRITGVFGYGNDYPGSPYENSGDKVDDNPMTISQTTLKLTSASLIAIGMTLRVESEQMFVSAFDTGTKTATVSRGVNGTTAASHVKDTAIYVYRFPEAISHATLIQAAREWRRRQSAYANRIENVILGTVEVFKDLDPSYHREISRYRRYRMWRSM